MQHQVKRTTLSRALGLVLLGMASSAAMAQQAQTEQATQQEANTAGQAQAPAQGDAANQSVTDLDRVVATGFRQSLEYSTQAKRDSTGFTDSIFAEDIGKFPDMNIAESLARIPGIQLNRDVNGEGLNVAIRGLPSSFTKTTINGASVATASIGLDATNQNREVDLNLFPTEFFSQVKVYKSPTAALPEGGAAGVVDMRNVRPFDSGKTQVTYTLEAGYNDIADKVAPRGTVIGSWVNDEGTFGVLGGITSTRGHIGVEGYETVGWTNPNLTNAQCGNGGAAAGFPALGQPCNVTGGNGWRIPDTVPNNASTIAAGLTPGQTIDAALLQQLNPGLTTAQIGEALIPRLGRPVHMSGDRDRDSFLGSVQWRPNENIDMYMDVLYTKAKRTNDRIDMNLIGRNGGMIPIDMQLDANNVVTSATFTNAQFFLEARPYTEDVQYWQVTPGGTFYFDEDVKLDVQGSYSRSWMRRDSPTILFNSPFTTLQYTNNGDVPSWTTDLDLNDPNLGWTWTGGRVWAQNEKRVTETKGLNASLQLGDDRNNVTFGVAWDTNYRTIVGFGDTGTNWQPYALAQVPSSALPNYITPGPFGFVTVDFDRFMRDTNYAYYRDTAGEANGANTGAPTGGFDEANTAAFVMINGESEVWHRNMRYNMGVRYASTDQDISGPVTINGVRNWQTLTGDYAEWLPSFSAAWDVAKDVVLRTSASRTMTRPNPSSMLPATTFTDISAQVANQGNPDLTPYISTNFDIGGEWYTGGEGFVGLTLFNKRIEGYTYQGVTTRPFTDLGIPFDSLLASQQQAINSRGGPDVATVNVQQQVNADAELEIRGWELIWVQPLGMVLDGLGFMANYSKLDISTIGKDAKALAGNVYGVAPSMWNATVYWENDVAQARLSYNWQEGAVGTGPNQQGIPFAQIYGEDRGQLDLSTSYTLANVWSKPQIYFNVTNILGEERRSFFAYDNAVNDMYDPGTTYTVGVRGTF
ncbi:TonB-dependent receptor [Lysobacter sp. LF1]|uniref:TonB-dependent receptor n=1 Tax=Lysobacter stagni TaxID=3045172 RepID=A0ABT6XE82_9GAMM|nr:TonB-dependent receptor [Lysobacter sp. LF1]MDI9238446.1 TonB-dependent receptor [Lysobacter sp. LF1]